MKRIAIAVLALVVAGGLGLSQAKAAGNDCQPVEVEKMTVKDAETVAYHRGGGYRSNYRHSYRPYCPPYRPYYRPSWGYGPC